MKEIWKNIEGYEGLYKISNTGKVFSILNNILLKQNKSGSGYPSVNMSINKNKRHFDVHRLVAIAFIPNPDNKRTVNHIDGNKNNNNVTNLEWVSHSYNLKHAYDNGLRKPWTKRIAQYSLDMELLNVFESQRIAAKETNTNQRSISSVCNGHTNTANGFIWQFA